jgi:hypothetical protein
MLLFSLQNKNSLQNIVENFSKVNYFEGLKIHGMVTLRWIIKKYIFEKLFE